MLVSISYHFVKLINNDTIYAWADVSDFKYRVIKMFLLKFLWEFQNWFKSYNALKKYKEISTKWNAQGIYFKGGGILLDK